MANGKMNASRIGTIPSEAQSGGTLNESLPAEQRVAEAPTAAKPSEGPKRGSKGEFLPATYQIAGGRTRTDR